MKKTTEECDKIVITLVLNNDNAIMSRTRNIKLNMILDMITGLNSCWFTEERPDDIDIDDFVYIMTSYTNETNKWANKWLNDLIIDTFLQLIQLELHPCQYKWIESKIVLALYYHRPLITYIPEVDSILSQLIKL